jgi:hypothetical protein
MHKSTSVNNWQGHISISIIYEAGQEEYLWHPSGGQNSILSGSPEMSLFGDTQDIDYDHTWLPIIKTLVFLHSRYLRDLLLGKAVLEVRTYSMNRTLTRGMSIWGRPQMLWIYTPSHVLTKHALTIFKKSNNQLFIRASKDIPDLFLGDFKARGFSWIFETLVDKSDFDLFWRNLFSQYGNDTPQAMRASLQQWIKRPAFTQDPGWQVFLCFVMLASLGP